MMISVGRPMKATSLCTYWLFFLSARTFWGFLSKISFPLSSQQYRGNIYCNFDIYGMDLIFYGLRLAVVYFGVPFSVIQVLLALSGLDMKNNENKIQLVSDTNYIV